MNGNSAMRRVSAAVSQKEIAGLVRYTNHSSGAVTSGQCSGEPSRKSQARWVGPSAVLHGEFAESGTSVL